jgi:hypothetical protein
VGRAPWLAGEVEAVVGSKRRRNPEREAYRWGSTASEFVLGGRKVALPRVRRCGAAGPCEVAGTSKLRARQSTMGR